LVFHVVSDNRHVGVANGICIITLGPELSTPQFYFDFRVCFEEMIGGDTFDFLDHFREPYVWNSLDKKVDVVFVDSNLEEVDIVGGSKFQTDVGEGFRDWWCEYISAVLHWADQVVDE
jgi:hypothetical protein